MTDGSYTCGKHANMTVKLMVSYVVYTAGCEECTRKAFAEALESALGKNKQPPNGTVHSDGSVEMREVHSLANVCPQCGQPKLYPGKQCYRNQNTFHNP